MILSSRACIAVDKNGDSIAWRYTSNMKVSVNEELCVECIETVLHPALGYPKPRDYTHLVKQGVIVCECPYARMSLARQSRWGWRQYSNFRISVLYYKGRIPTRRRTSSKRTQRPPLSQRSLSASSIEGHASSPRGTRLSVV